MVVAASRLTAAKRIRNPKQPGRAATPCLDRARAPCHIALVSRVMYVRRRDAMRLILSAALPKEMVSRWKPLLACSTS